MLKIIAVLFLVILSESALASKWIIGGSLAAARSENDDALLNSQLANSGLNATAQTDDDIRIRWQIYAGYDFSERWGVELGYLDMGKVETTFTGTTVDIEAFLNSAQDIHPQTAQGWLISMTHYIPIDYATRVKLRAGMYNWAADYTLQGGNVTKSVSQDGSDISYGIGLEFGEWHTAGATSHIKWEHYSIDDNNVGVIAFGFSFGFE